MVMTRGKLLRVLDNDRIMEAMREAGNRNSVAIAISVSPLFWGDVPKVAQRAFRRMGLPGAGNRDAVLFFVVPARRAFVVLGGDGIHARVGQECWDRMSEALSDHFRKGEFTEGLVKAIKVIGEHRSQPLATGFLPE